MPRLVVFALRRTLPPWLLVGLGVLLVLASRASGGALRLALDERGAAAVRALARQNVWSVLLVTAPLLLFLAARLGTSAAKAWLAPTPVRPLPLAFALALGCALSAQAATALTALVAESTTAESGTLDGSPDDLRPAWRVERALASPAAVLFDDSPRVSWSVAALAPGERLRLEVRVALGAGPAATARLSARAEGAGAASVEVEERVAGRAVLELAPPASSGPLTLELQRVGPGALLVVGPEALTVLAPVASERSGALALGLRVGLALAAGCALALGLGSVLRPALAAGLVLALACAAMANASAARFFCGADLAHAWQELAAGLVPGPLPRASFAGTLLVFALGIGLHAYSFRRSEGTP